MAESRLGNLYRRLDKNPELKQKYTTVIEDYITNGYAEKIEKNIETKLRWYLSHHAVLHPQKPGKVQVVFHCSANSKGKSLNQKLLRGSDLLSNLIGVFLRFRKKKIAMVRNIEAMFHQVRVIPNDRDFLRFL